MPPRLSILVVLLLTAAGCAGHGRYDVADNVLYRPDAADRELWHHWMKNSYFYPTRLALLRTPPATNLDDRQRIRPGSFFTGLSPQTMTPRQIALGNTTDDGAPVMPMQALKKIKRGTTSGFWAKDARGRRYLVKLDPTEHVEMATAAELIGSRAFHALGYHVPEVYLVRLTVLDYPELTDVRATASPFLPGDILGTFKFDDLRNRREMRGLKLLAAWINNTDCVDHNTLVTWHGGKARFVLLDFNGSLGSRGTEPKSPRCGWEPTFSLRSGLAHVLTLGRRPVPWDEAMPIVSPAVGRFDERLDPRRWTTFYPNPAFIEMTDDDARWMARRLAGFTDEKIDALVASAGYSRKADAQYVAKVLKARRDVILAAWPTPHPAPGARTP